MAIVFDDLNATATYHLAAFSPIRVTGLLKTDWSTAFLSLNYRIEVEIFFGAEVFASFDKRPNSDGTVSPFDISTYLNSRFNLLDLPDLTASCDQYAGASFKFQIRYREVWTGSSESWQTDPLVYWADAAGMQLGQQWAPELLLYTAPTSVAAFLTKFEVPVLYYNLPFGLCFIWEVDVGAQVHLCYKRSEPSGPTDTDGFTTITVEPGINFIALNYLPTSSFVWVWLRNNITTTLQYTEMKKIELRAFPSCNFQISWVNDLGGLEFYTFTGPKSEEIIPESGTLFSGDFSQGTTAEQKTDERVLEVRERRTTTVGLDSIPASHAVGLAELLTSVEVAELGEGAVWKPKQVKREAYVFNDLDDTGNEFEITLVDPERRKPRN